MENTLKLLLVEPNEELTAALEKSVRAAKDMELLSVAKTGKEALSLCERLKPDVLITELILPELDGLGLLQRLSEREERPTALVLTNFVTPLSVNLAMEAGAAYFLSKPCEPELVLERIRAFAPHRTISEPKENTRGIKTKEIDELAISELLRELGVPAQIKGYFYLREAIAETVKQDGELQMVTKCLYPMIARHYGTTASRVERAIRHAIELSWCRGNEEELRACFGHSVSANDRPTNSQYIASVAERLLIQLRAKSA